MNSHHFTILPPPVGIAQSHDAAPDCDIPCQNTSLQQDFPSPLSIVHLAPRLIFLKHSLSSSHSSAWKSPPISRSLKTGPQLWHWAHSKCVSPWPALSFPLPRARPLHASTVLQTRTSHMEPGVSAGQDVLNVCFLVLGRKVRKRSRDCH